MFDLNQECLLQFHSENLDGAGICCASKREQEQVAGAASLGTVTGEARRQTHLPRSEWKPVTGAESNEVSKAKRVG